MTFNNDVTHKQENKVKYRSIVDLYDSGDYDGPEKYLIQKEQPVEVDPSIIKKLFIAIDS
jgi:hypothetical protein